MERGPPLPALIARPRLRMIYGMEAESLVGGCCDLLSPLLWQDGRGDGAQTCWLNSNYCERVHIRIIGTLLSAPARSPIKTYSVQYGTYVRVGLLLCDVRSGGGSTSTVPCVPTRCEESV
jgi:hypothetical protein